MPTLADLHVHIYPSYDYSQIFDQIFSSFNLVATKNNLAVNNYLIALTEREDCNFYEEFKTNKITLPKHIEKEVGAHSITLIKENKKLIIFPGRQINTIEKIELLSLGSDYKIANKKDLTSTIEQIKEHKAVPVINWAPGKWWFKRGQIIKDFISKRKDLVLCDTSLRPVGYTKPALMKFAEKQGTKLIYGSDPLPNKLEQENIGRYLTYYENDIEPNLESFHYLLLNNQGRALGKRSSFLELFFRLKRYYKEK